MKNGTKDVSGTMTDVQKEAFGAWLEELNVWYMSLKGDKNRSAIDQHILDFIDTSCRDALALAYSKWQLMKHNEQLQIQISENGKRI